MVIGYTTAPTIKGYQNGMLILRTTIDFSLMVVSLIWKSSAYSQNLPWDAIGHNFS